MRRLISLLLLVTAVAVQTPIACVAGTHAPSVAADPAAHAHHAMPGEQDGHAVARHQGHGEHGSAARHGHWHEGAADAPGDAPPACAAAARCQTSALPETATAVADAAPRPELDWHVARLQPPEPVPSFPTPPPRALS